MIKNDKVISNNVLKILVVNDVFPHIKNRTTILFKNIVPIIKKKLEIKVFWVITDDYGERIKVTDPDYEISYLSDYNNAREVLEKIKPDLSYHLIGNSIMDYAFMVAERFLKISNFGFADSDYVSLQSNNEVIVPGYFVSQTSRKKIFLENVRQFFVVKNTGTENNIKASSGKNYLKKWYFLIRTLRSIQKSRLEIILEVFELLKLFYREPPVNCNEKYNCDLIFTENSISVDYLVKSGLKRENFRVVGNPVFDNVLEKRDQILSKDDKKLNILFITANLESGQGKSNFSKSKRNKMIKEIITSLNQFHKETSLVIKIHPTAENYTEYKQLLEKFENVCISQKDDIIDLISKSDVIITPTTSTATFIALIMNKPIIIWNYFHVEQDFLLGTDTVLECKNISELSNCLDSARSFRDKNAEKINKLINEFLTNSKCDGKSSQRIAGEILDFIKRQNPHLC